MMIMVMMIMMIMVMMAHDNNGDVDHGDDYTDVNPVVTVRLLARLVALWFRCQ